MKKINLLLLAILMILAGCKKKANDVNVNLVEVKNEVTTIGSTEAYFECEFTYDGEITKALLVYGEDDAFKYAQTSALILTAGKWTSQISYLEKKTKYFYKYEFYNNYNHMETTAKSFTTTAEQNKPSVETVSIDDITMTSAKVEGNVTNDGGSAVTERGICYSIYENPTLSDSIRLAGTGIGRFTCNMTNLTNATTYYVRAFATNSEGTSFGEVFTMRTIEHPILASVTTDEVSNISINSAVCGGNVTNDGYADVTERGICYATHEEPTVFDFKVEGGEGLGLFQCRMSDLEVLTKYYVRAYALNSEGYAYGNEVNFTTADETMLPEVITKEIKDITHFNAIGVGEVVANGGLEIVERGICWSTSPNPVTTQNKLTAGTGMGEFELRMQSLFHSTTYYVRAFAANAAGMAYGNEISFTTDQHPNVAPEGSIPSLFSISETQQVFFSKGNLQYQASTGTWRFAEHQYDYVGGNYYETEYGNVYENGVKCDNSLISPTYNGWIDLFGWATSGWNNNNVYYQPYDYQSTDWVVNGYGYGYWDGEYAQYDMTGDYANCDWGVYNPISNGGNEAGRWRTLSIDEWSHILQYRTNAAYKFSKATVNDCQGFIILPDAWILPEGLNFVGSASNYETNTYNQTEWTTMENAGAVFIPNAGERTGINYSKWDSCQTWCANSGWNHGSAVYFYVPYYYEQARYYGFSVRLVQNY